MKVKIINQDRLATVVQWYENGENKAGIIPTMVLAMSPENDVDPAELAAAIPYGEPWEEIINAKFDVNHFAHELRRLGIWTIDDLRQNAMHINGAVLRSVNINQQTIAIDLKNFKEKIS